MGSKFSKKKPNEEEEQEQDTNEMPENENDLKIELYPKKKLDIHLKNLL